MVQVSFKNIKYKSRDLATIYHRFDERSSTSLRAGVLGDGLGPFRHGVLGQLSRQQEPYSSLDLTGGYGGPFVVVSQSAALGGNPLENVVHERVHYGHSLGGYPSVRVDLLEHLVDVDGIRLFPLLFPVSFLTTPLLRSGSIFSTRSRRCLHFLD